MANDLDYWKDAIMVGADECGLTLTDEQATYLADIMSGSHENYGMAFYSPPASDRLADIERGWRAKYEALEKEFNKYRGNAETAVRIALKQRHDEQVRIGEHGTVERVGGRIEQIQ